MITKEQAEDIRQAIATQFHAEEGHGPRLFDGSHEELREGSWVVSWEEGPYEWTYSAFDGGWDEEIYHNAINEGLDKDRARQLAATPATPQPHKDEVFVEPVNHYALGLYPA